MARAAQSRHVAESSARSTSRSRRSRCRGTARSTVPIVTSSLDATAALDRLRLALATVALDATRLERSRVRRCDGAQCVLLYYDTARNRSRRWCDMAVCGNRAKASAHYHRTKHGPTR